MNPQNHKSDSHRIALGTAAIGRPQYINLRQELPQNLSLQQFRQKGYQVLESAYNQGIRYFDTAPGYGMAEQLLIDWLHDKQPDGVEVATKWGYTYTAGFDPNAEVHEIKEHSLSKLNEQWKQSQALLPYLTTYQIHSATLESGVLENREVLERLAELKREYGLLIGMSSTGTNQVEVIEKALGVEVAGEALFDAFQVTYNVLDQSFFHLGKAMQAAGKRLIIKEALANGRMFPNAQYPHYTDLYQQLESLADKYSVGIDAVALRFCLDSLSPYCVLSGASNESHIQANLKANLFQLEMAEIENLQQLAVPVQDYWQERKRLAWT
jgi:aryl-alcohol dehydrogenase-like predicted oxidoreductase